MGTGHWPNNPVGHRLRLGGVGQEMVPHKRAQSSVRRESEIHIDFKWKVREQTPALFMESQQAPHRENASTGNPPSLPNAT